MWPLHPRITIALSLIALACFLLGMLLAHLEWIEPIAGLVLFSLGGILGFFCFCDAVYLMITRQAYGTVMVCTPALMPFIAVLAQLLALLRYPMLHDVATDLENPPQFQSDSGDVAPFQYLASDRAKLRDAYPDLQPLLLAMPRELAFKHLLAAIRTEAPDWIVSVSDPETGHIEGRAKTKILRFEDDYALRVSATETGGSRIDMRSRSRVGQSDLGLNARRIRQFLEQLDMGPK